MNLLFAINHNFTELLCGCLTSVLKNAGFDRYEVYILHKNGLPQYIQNGYDWLIQALRQTVGNVTAVAGGREIADHIVPPLAAASRWRQISAQLGSLLSFSAKSFSAPGTSMFWGHIRVH